jgi:hypothetical protein
MPTDSTPQQYRPNRRTLSTPTTRTAEPIGPAQLQKILSASLLSAEAELELLQVPRVVFHPHMLGIAMW